MSDTSWIR